MNNSVTDTLRGQFPELLLFVATGLVVFTLVRLTLGTYGIDGWRITIISLASMFIILETLVQVGWLNNPLSGTED